MLIQSDPEISNVNSSPKHSDDDYNEIIQNSYNLIYFGIQFSFEMPKLHYI